MIYWLYRALFYIRDPYVPGSWWRPIYRVRNYVLHVLPLDLQIAREHARWVALKFTSVGS